MVLEARLAQTQLESSYGTQRENTVILRDPKVRRSTSHMKPDFEKHHVRAADRDEQSHGLALESNEMSM